MISDDSTQDPNNSHQAPVTDEEIQQLIEDIEGPKPLAKKIGEEAYKKVEQLKNIDLSKIDKADFWQQLKEFGVAGLSAATGDPEAMKTIVEVLANATHMGLEKINLKDESQDTIRKKIEDAVDSGADGVIKVITTFQEQAGSSNEKLREKYGRKYRNKDESGKNDANEA